MGGGGSTLAAPFSLRTGPVVLTHGRHGWDVQQMDERVAVGEVELISVVPWRLSSMNYAGTLPTSHASTKTSSEV